MQRYAPRTTHRVTKDRSIALPYTVIVRAHRNVRRHRNRTYETQKEKKMASTIDTRSLLIGLLLALILLLALGAAGHQGEYRLSMAASDNWVIYGRINTLTGDEE